MLLGEKRGISYYPRILLLGSTGFFAQHLKPILEERYPAADLIYDQGSKFFDLRQQPHARTLFKSVTDNAGAIQVVINLAALSGGMFQNMEHQGTFWYQNITILTNVIEQCAAHRVRKLLIPIGGCSYPNESPDGSGIFKEEDIWAGFPNENSYGYSMAKKQAIIAGKAYEQEFGLKTHVLIVTNPIGPWDNVDEKNSHVVMGLIKRFVEAKQNKYSNVTVYGSGKPVRDFICIKDAMKLFPEFIKYYDEVGPMNISTGVGTSIAELAELISKAVGFEGRIVFDRSKPDGQLQKTLDNTKLKNFLKENEIEWSPTPLDEALAVTVEWYMKRAIIQKKVDVSVG